MFQWLGYIIARIIAGVLVALIVALLLKNNKQQAQTAGATASAL